MTPGSPARGLGLLLRVALLVMVIVSIGTCFSALSQYPTDDQRTTLARLKAFAKNVDSVQLDEGSHVSALVVAPVGYCIRAALDRYYLPDELIAWELHYTPYLPFAMAQVMVALTLIFLLSALVSRLARGRIELDAFLLTAVVLLNFPMLKALVKVLKYDALSTLLCAVAIALYVERFRRRAGSQTPVFDPSTVGAIAVFCGLAFLEKDTSISIAILIAGVELAVVLLRAESTRAALAGAAGFLAIFVPVFVMTTIILVPKILRDPSHYPELFNQVASYFVNVPSILAILIVGLLVLGYLIVPRAKPLQRLCLRWPEVVPKLLLGVSMVIALSAIGAFAFQDNVLYDATSADNDIVRALSMDKSIYVSKPLAGASITTLDHSALIQSAKSFHSMVRVIFYTLPEVFVLMIIGSAPLFLHLAHAKPSFYAQQAGALLLLLLVPVSLLVAYSLAGVPVEAKYLSLATLLLLIYGLYPALMVQQRLTLPAVPAGFALLAVLTTLPAGPTYFGYKNVLRSRELENAAALDMNRVAWWTWAGWGETVYPIGRYLEANRRGPVTVAYDYLPPFYSVAGIRWVDAGLGSCRTQDQLNAKLAEIGGQGVDFVVVSKARSHQNWCLNQILRRMRPTAAFVDAQQGFEYGWLFRYSEVVRTFGKEKSH